MSRTVDALYRGIALAVARGFASLGFVRSVYARRSVACGEAALPRSDIDLTVVIEPSASLADEAERLLALARRLRALRRIVPVLGPPEVATLAELDLWYRAPWFPGSPERDRGWLRLWGDEVVRPPVDAAPADAWRQDLPWFFWAWQGLPDHVRARRVRTCCNLVLDMLNVALLGEGAVHGPQRRAALVDAWAKRTTEAAQLEQVRAALRGRVPARPDALLRWLYGQSLRIAHQLPDAVSYDVARSAPLRVATRVPFAYVPRTYLLVDPDDARAVDAGFDEMRTTKRTFLTTPRTLARYFRERNPWEWWCVDDGAARDALPVPDDDAVLRAIRYYLHRVALRRFGLAIGTGADRRDTVAPQYAQARLWLERRLVASSLERLLEAWREGHGAWPYAEVRGSDEFFARAYPALCREVGELAARVGVAGAAAKSAP